MNANALARALPGAVELPAWVPPVFREVYRMVAEKRGEEEAAALARRLKNPDAADGSWSPARIEILVRTWLEGATAAKSAKAIGVARNAVIGKRARLGLAADTWKRPALVALSAHPVATDVEPPPPPVDGGVALLDLQRSQCRWPVADGPPMRFCGAKKPDGAPAFCATHALRAYAGRPSIPKSILKAAKR